MNLNYLNTPSNSSIPPPIKTKKHELPLEKLIWEDFEKLCLALVEIDFSIDDCECFGIKGQAQEGIDIYARLPSGRYYSYQCKRYENFKVSDLEKAVKYFEDKDFYEKSDKLYLCTSSEWNKTQVQKKFDILKTRLNEKKITLVKWDKIQISRVLKDHPQIVYDFFGAEWVKRFNGEEALKTISQSKKLDANQVSMFRKDLYKFYSTVFNVHDPGIPSRELKSSFNLQERFIIPDILSNANDDNTKQLMDRSFDNEASNSHEDIYFYDNFYQWYGELDDNFGSRRYNEVNINLEENNFQTRIKLEDALLSNDRNVIIGDPGAGKSSLLRYLTLDILSSIPNLENVSKKYGKTLPLWLPFAFISKYLAKDDSLSIHEILKLWFNIQGEPQLFDIVKSAFEDERLFLIIDGIDEWTNRSSAIQAITRIETIRELHNCKVLYSGRPYGFKELKDYFTHLAPLHLAGFSFSQKKEFTLNWYKRWSADNGTNNNSSFVEKITEDFFRDLERADDLMRLAETPLLLSVLIVQKMKGSTLPKSKLEALDEITRYLINTHPKNRINQAGIVEESSADLDFKDIFCELAMHIQKESKDGVILKDEAKRVISEYLLAFADYNPVSAKIRSQELIKVGADSFGIIIEKSNDEISFSHKQFQEFLASQYLIDSDEDSINEFILNYAGDPAYHQVIVAFFGLIPTRQVKKFTIHFEKLKEIKSEILFEDYMKLLQFEISISSENVPSEIMNNSFDDIIHRFEFETDPTFKKALLHRILSSVQNGRLREKAENFLTKFFPNENRYRDFRIVALQHSKELNSVQLDFLRKSLVNGTIAVQRDVSHVLSKHIENQGVFDIVKDLINNCSTPNILAFAINSIISKKLDQQMRDDLINSIETDDPIVRFYLFKYKVFFDEHTQDDLDLAINIINQLSYEFDQESIDLLINGFSENSKLKVILLRSAKRRNYDRRTQNTINDVIAWKVLFHCFNKDHETIQLISSEFENEKYPFSITSRGELFQHLLYYFKGNQELVGPVENWLRDRLKEYHYIDNETSYACAFIRTEESKQWLINDLPNSGISHWNLMALLEGWSNDPEVKSILKEYYRTTDKIKTSASAHFISKVFDDKEKKEAISILEEILFDDKLTFRERAIPALIELDNYYFEARVLPSLIEQLDSFPKDFFGQYYSALNSIVEHYPKNNIVQDYVLERLELDINLYNLAVRYFPELIANESNLLEKSSPLPKDLRLLIIDYFKNLSVVSPSIQTTLEHFENESFEEIKSEMALCLFNHVKESNPEQIIKICEPLKKSTGIHYDLNRNIAFIGHLITHNLDDYFLKEVGQVHKSFHISLFNDYNGRSSSDSMIKAIIDNFDYLISYFGDNLGDVTSKLGINTNVELIWGFLARHSTRSSQTRKHLVQYVYDNRESISNISILSYLNRTESKSPLLKDILLRLVEDNNKDTQVFSGRLLGANFNNDSQVYNAVKNNLDLYEPGKVMALCKGWPKDQALQDLFENLVEGQVQTNHYVGFSLKFLFRDINNLKKFLKEILENQKDIKYYHRYFIIPLLERLTRDENFSNAVKDLLMNSKTISERISYFNLLSKARKVDDEISIWKDQFTVFKNDFGYDIVSNQTVRLKDVLHDYTY